MSNNETLQKTVIILMLINFVLPTSVPDASDLYGRFTNRLEEVANFAQSEFKKSTSETLKKIYAMNAKILQEQIAERKNAAEVFKPRKDVPKTRKADTLQNNSACCSNTVNITLQFPRTVEGAVEVEQPIVEEVNEDELEFQFPANDSDLQLAIRMKGGCQSNDNSGCSKKRENYDGWLESDVLEQFIDEMSAPARRMKGNCNCGCENCRSLTKLCSERASCSCNCDKCNKCKRNEKFNYGRKFRKRFQGKRDVLPFAYPTDDVYTKILSTPYNPVMSPDTTLEKLLRANIEMPGGNNSFMEGVGSD